MAVAEDQLINVSGVTSVGFGPVAASTMIYGGTLCFFASGFVDDDDNAGANQFAGIARETYDNSSGSAGDQIAEFYDNGKFELQGSGFSQATVGADIYATDNYTVTTSSTDASYIGKCVAFVSSTKIIVKIETTPSFDGTGA